MSYTVIARKWRPKVFNDVIAQDHVVRTLENSITSDRIAHAYLFTGPRGVGKTSTARILAKSLNCVNGPTVTPCSTCSTCIEISEGRNLDVLEIDGASNRGIDEIRNLRENVRYVPSSGRYKIYIIDEVHMLTTQAFNALLKTLEEPPAHVIFIFATTEPHQVPPTILSRCQRFDFKRVPLNAIMKRLQHICANENITIDSDSLLLLAKKADGSMRDAESLLDQVASFSGKSISVESISSSLGLIDQEIFFHATDSIAQHNPRKGLDLIKNIISKGYDFGEFIVGLLEHLRNILVVKITENIDEITASEYIKDQYGKLAETFSEEDLLRLIEITSMAEATMKRSSQPLIRLETALLKMIFMDKSVQIADILSHLKELAGLEPKTNHMDISEEETQTKETLNLFNNLQSPTQQIKTYKTRQSPSPGIAEPLPHPESKKQTEPKPSISPVTVEQLQEKWPQIIAKVKESSTRVGTFLEMGKPESITEKTITILLYNSVQKDSLLTNKKIISEAIEQVLNKKFLIKYSKGKRSEEKKTSKENKMKNHKKIIDDLRKREPLIGDIIDIFNGELVEYKPGPSKSEIE